MFNRQFTYVNHTTQASLPNRIDARSFVSTSRFPLLAYRKGLLCRVSFPTSLLPQMQVALGYH